MTVLRKRSEEIRAFILTHLGQPDLASRITSRFHITRQAANRHLKTLSNEGVLVSSGRTRRRSYTAAPTQFELLTYAIRDGLAEDVVWRNDVRPLLGNLADNVLAIWNFAFTEMFNNAIDHSSGSQITVSVTKSAAVSQIVISDDGVGIFHKIQQALNLPDEKQAIFELAKGKLTTDAANHSGQGIFFTSRMVNEFDIFSGGICFSHELGDDADFVFDRDKSRPGTRIHLEVDNHTARTVKKVYAQYSVNGSYGFNKTVIPVKLAKYGSDQLVSRSQAKRVLLRVDQFSQVILDFSEVDMIGQAFADQIFRVFANEHSEVELIPAHANAEVMGLIQAAIKSGRPGFKGVLKEGL